MSRTDLAVRAERAGFAYIDAVSVFKDATFVLRRGWSGLVGENGAGKSTLLKLIAGELQASDGYLRVEPGSARVVSCPQSVDERTPELDALAYASDAAAHKLRAQLGLELAGYARWPSLSPGERKRWQLGAALYAEPDVLLLDEPTNHLDQSGRAFVVAALREFRGVGLLVSHDRALLDALTHATLRLHHGELHVYAGSYAAARAQWEAERASLLHERHKAQHEQARKRAQLDRMQRDEQATSRNKSTGRRMKNRHDSDARTLGASVRVDWAQKSAGKRVAAISHKAQQADSALASLSVDKELGRSVFLEHTRPHRSWLLSLAEPLRLPGGACVHVPAVARDARIWLRGPNGAGKTSVLCALLAEANLAPGRILYLPQNLGQDDGARELAAVRGMPEELRSRVLSIVAALGVEPSRLLASHSPSPGEARKLMLARGMAQQCSILVLDEPENHLDLPSIERLQQALALYPGALLLVSHDEALARHVARSEWLLSDGALRVGELAS